MKFYQKKCKSCEAWEYKRAIDIVGYNDWKSEHLCSINHTGCAGAMEVVGIQKMFGRSVNLHGLRYTFCIGDDDTKSFDHICKSDPYLPTPLQKENVLVMSKKELVPGFAMSRANIKGKSSLTTKVSVAVKDP